MNGYEGRGGTRAADRVLNKNFQEGHTARHGGQTLHKASKKWAGFQHSAGPNRCTLTPTQQPLELLSLSTSPHFGRQAPFTSATSNGCVQQMDGAHTNAFNEHTSLTLKCQFHNQRILLPHMHEGPTRHE